MTAIHETFVDAPEPPLVVSLAELEEIGSGVVCVGESRQLEPVFVYVGEGTFYGLALEVRQNSSVQSLRLRVEIHPQAPEEVGSCQPIRILTSRIKVTEPESIPKQLLPLIIAEYDSRLDDWNDDAEYLLSQPDTVNRRNLLHKIHTGLSKGELSPDQLGGIDITSVYAR